MKLPGTGEVDAESFLAEKAWQDDKMFFIREWRERDALMSHRVQDAIRHAVAAELLARDARCYGLPPSGRPGLEKTVEKTPGQKETIFVVNEDWARVRHTGLDIKDENMRRVKAFFALRPKFQYAKEWIATVEGDDGKDEAGKWLCREHSGQQKTFEQRVDEEFSGEVPPATARRDVGFGVGSQWRKPVWLKSPPAEWCECPPAEALTVPA